MILINYFCRILNKNIFFYLDVEIFNMPLFIVLGKLLLRFSLVKYARFLYYKDLH